MKILFIIDVLIAGGAEIVLKNLSNYFAKKYEVAILVFQDRIDYKIEDFKDIQVIFLNKKYFIKRHNRSIIKYIKYRYFYYSKLISILKHINPDIVIPFKTDNVRLLSRIKEYGLFNFLIIGSIHGSYKMEESDFDTLQKQYSNINALTVLTQEDKNFFTKYLNKPIYVMQNPMELVELKLAKEKIILFVSRMVKGKRADIFIKAIKLCEKKIKDYRIIIIGDGPYLQDIKELALSINLNISFLGSLPHIEVLKYYAKSEIFVMSSEMEGYPCVLQEAMFYECARICTKFVSGSLNILIQDGIDGLLCELDEFDMSNKLVNLIHNNTLKTNIIKCAKSKYFTLNKNAYSDWDKLLDNVIQER